MNNEKIIGFLTLCNMYKCRPSSLMDIGDPYTAYCFDEACAYIMQKIEKGEEPQFKKDYKSFKDFYSQFE